MKFKKNKSPGLDGITAEFYIKFWDLVKGKLMQVYEEAFDSGVLPESLRTGVIVLLEKKGKDRMNIANWRPITLLGVDYKLLTKTLAERLKNVLPNLVHPDQNGFMPGGCIFFSAHTIRDILFYCNKERLDLILLALDYTKAFDSVEFEFIHKTFEVFNFGPDFRQWIKILFNSGKSCVANNGFLSSTFPIERSTRQGDPISPLIFILVLEILFINIRADGLIKGIRILENEVKLTSYADDATYFVKDLKSAEALMTKIDQFTQVSGLEVNRTKSECLLLDYEMNLSRQEDKVVEIPIVDNLKILGHFFGKNRLVCEYQNFYAKLGKVDKVINMWKQRTLTIMGKSLLINALLNSLFIFNAQIECPPKDFIKLINARNKSFLWDGGVPKISHHSLIGDFGQGGIRYKDVESLLSSVNMKFIFRIKTDVVSNSTCLPRLWLLQLFGVPLNCENAEQQVFQDFFCKSFNILDCKFTLPKRAKWKGHPFYWDVLLSLETILVQNETNSVEASMSTPIWFNRDLNTTFNANMSKNGLNFIWDIYHSRKRIGEKNANQHSLVDCQVLSLYSTINSKVKEILKLGDQQSVVILPMQTIKYKNRDKMVKNMTSVEFYELFIAKKIQIPIGILNWCLDFELNNCQISTALDVASRCSASIFDKMFQYKIVTKILPTNEYLFRYKVKESATCDFCNLERDTVVHRLYECEVFASKLNDILIKLKKVCKLVEHISLTEYLFGKMGSENLGLNHVILELKKYIFYASFECLNSPSLSDLFFNHIKNLIIREKYIALRDDRYENFCLKWHNFAVIYDFKGPDPEIV